jgi:methionyl-tRNA formyltransferase
LENASEVFLDQKYTARDLLNLLRGRTFLPYNGCFFYDNGQKFEIQINIKKVKDE